MILVFRCCFVGALLGIREGWWALCLRAIPIGYGFDSNTHGVMIAHGVKVRRAIDSGFWGSGYSQKPNYRSGQTRFHGGSDRSLEDSIAVLDADQFPSFFSESRDVVQEILVGGPRARDPIFPLPHVTYFVPIRRRSQSTKVLDSRQFFTARQLQGRAKRMKLAEQFVW